MKVAWRREAVSLAIIGAMFAAAAWSWPRVPDRMPIHWNAAGQADGYGGKFLGLLFIPLVTAAMYALFLALPKLDPGKRNFPSFDRSYATLRTGFLLFFAVLYAAALAAAFGRQFNMISVIMPAVGALLLVIGNVMSKIRPNYTVGIRTPWTLSSKRSWNKTHRLAGWLFLLQGASFVALGFASPSLLLPVILGSTLAMFCILLPYSYHVYASDPDRMTPAGVAPADEGDLDGASSKGDPPS